MRILVAATKPPWPPIDGGRLLLWNSLQALHELGAEVVLVAPLPGPASAPSREEAMASLEAVCRPHLVPVAAESKGALALRAVSRPLTIARHSRRAVRRRVDELLATGRVQVVHAEQLQALPQVAGAWRLRLPVVLRAQNVESDLYRLWAGRTPGLSGMLLAAEAGRLARWEGRAVAGVAETWALSRPDADRLAALAPGEAKVAVVPPPFPELARVEGPLEGSPAVTLLGSGGWKPNEDALRWFLAEAWPEVLRSEPGAILHLYGEVEAGAAPSLRRHGPLRDSAEAFPAGSIQVVPLRVGSGVRIKILEAWARGVPVVGTPQAFAGLEVEPGVEGLVAGDGPGLAREIVSLHRSPDRARGLVERAGERLRRRHAPAVVGRQMMEAYARLAVEWPGLRTRR